MIKRMESTYCIIELDSKGGHDDLSNVGTNLGEPHFKRKGKHIIMIKRMESTYCIIELDSKGGHDDLSNVGTNLGEPHFKRKGNMENGRGGVR